MSSKINVNDNYLQCRKSSAIIEKCSHLKIDNTHWLLMSNGPELTSKSSLNKEECHVFFMPQSSQ